MYGTNYLKVFCQLFEQLDGQNVIKCTEISKICYQRRTDPAQKYTKENINHTFKPVYPFIKHLRV
jgi:hypothetical protein